MVVGVYQYIVSGLKLAMSQMGECLLVVVTARSMVPSRFWDQGPSVPMNFILLKHRPMLLDHQQL